MIDAVADDVRPDEREQEPHLTPAELAARYNVAERTLENWRRDNIGPDWVLLGKNTIRYRLVDVVAYEEARRRRKAKEQEHAN